MSQVKLLHITMEETGPETQTERKARGRALLSRLQATREKLEGMVPQKQSFKGKKPKRVNEASVREWQMFHFTSQLVNWFRLSSVFLAMAVVVLAWGNLTLSNRGLAYLTAPAPIAESAQKELGARINQSAKLDNLRLFLSTILPRLKEIHYQQAPDLTPLKGLVSPAILNEAMSYRRGLEQATRINQIVLTLTVDARSIENYVYNQTDNRFSFEIKGIYRISAQKTGGDIIRNEPFSAKIIMEEVPLSGANPFGFFLVSLEEGKQ